MSNARVPCVVIRGGTSKGVFLYADDLPEDPERRDAMILAIFGSPDPRQIDGLGGADPLTSKLAIIRRSERDDADIDYTFGQVSIDQASINYALNCGNLAAGAAIFAVDEGLVRARGPETTVRIFNTNTKTQIVATVPVADGRAVPHGDCVIDGVPGAGSAIGLTFMNTAGRVTGRLLPTSAPTNSIRLSSEKSIDVSIVDTGNVYVFVKASELGLSGREDPRALEQDSELISTIRLLLERSSALVNETLRPATPLTIHKLAMVSPRSNAASDSPVDFTARIVSSNGKPHLAFAVTGAICAGSAAVIAGTVVNRVLEGPIGAGVKIGHPQGVIEVGLDCQVVDGERMPVNVTIRRTARRIMEGYVYVDRSLVHSTEPVLLTAS